MKLDPYLWQEILLIGSMMADPEWCKKVLSMVTAKDFIYPETAEVYKRVANLRGRFTKELRHYLGFHCGVYCSSNHGDMKLREYLLASVRENGPKKRKMLEREDWLADAIASVGKRERDKLKRWDDEVYGL